MVDEEYCLVSTLVFILSAFKNAISYVKDELNIEKLDKKIRMLQAKKIQEKNSSYSYSQAVNDIIRKAIWD